MLLLFDLRYSNGTYHWNVCGVRMAGQSKRIGCQTQTTPFGSVIMGKYFKPLRRKSGVIMLVMACVFATWIVRSSTLRDRFRASVGRTHLCLVSIDSGWRFSRTISNDAVPLTFWETRLPASGGETDVADAAPIKWSWHFDLYGLEAGQGVFRGGKVPIDVFAVPYWMAVPLTMLSAYLLLSKPRVKPQPSASTSPNPCEPTPRSS